MHFHAENLNPYLPTLSVGMDISTTGAPVVSRQGSSATGSQREYDLLSRNVGPNTGHGLFTLDSPGFTWTIGQYRLRDGGFAQAEDKAGTPGNKRPHNFMIGHDLYLWSPNGWVSGSAMTPGSVLVGTHFERNDISCSDAAHCSAINGGQFHRNAILLSEWDLWYVIARRMSISASWLWFDAANLRIGANQACHNLRICSRDSGRIGQRGDWLDTEITWRYQF